MKDAFASFLILSVLEERVLIEVACDKVLLPRATHKRAWKKIPRLSFAGFEIMRRRIPKSTLTNKSYVRSYQEFLPLLLNKTIK
jgi:hypothetical protein